MVLGGMVLRGCAPTPTPPPVGAGLYCRGCAPCTLLCLAASAKVVSIAPRPPALHKRTAALVPCWLPAYPQGGGYFLKNFFRGRRPPVPPISGARKLAGCLLIPKEGAFFAGGLRRTPHPLCFAWLSISPRRGGGKKVACLNKHRKFSAGFFKFMDILALLTSIYSLFSTIYRHFTKFS